MTNRDLGADQPASRDAGVDQSTPTSRSAEVPAATRPGIHAPASSLIQPLVIELRLRVHPPSPVTTQACASLAEEVRTRVESRIADAYNVENTDWYLGER